MKIAVDTNVLVRAVMGDHPAQARAAARALGQAALIAIALPALCEFVLVLLKVYSLQRADLATAIRALIAAADVQVNRAAVQAGLQLLEAGGDFADGVIAFEGQWLGGQTFVSFYKKAVKLLGDRGQSAELL